MNAETGNGNGSPHVQQVPVKQEPAAPSGGAGTAQAESQDAARGNPKQWGARSIECFHKTEQIGEGQYGQVIHA